MILERRRLRRRRSVAREPLSVGWTLRFVCLILERPISPAVFGLDAIRAMIFCTVTSVHLWTYLLQYHSDSQFSSALTVNWQNVYYREQPLTRDFNQL